MKSSPIPADDRITRATEAVAEAGNEASLKAESAKSAKAKFRAAKSEWKRARKEARKAAGVLRKSRGKLGKLQRKLAKSAKPKDEPAPEPVAPPTGETPEIS